MRRYVWCAVFSSVVVLSGSSCKPMHDRDGLDPVSEPESAVSDSGMLLTAVVGKSRGVCLLESSLHNPKSVHLVTDRGAISEKQLKSALRFMGYAEHVVATLSGFMITAAAVLGMRPALKAAKITKENAVKVAKAVAITSLVGGAFGYRIIRGNVEGEKAAPIAVHTMLGLASAVPVAEYLHRDGRLKAVLSDKEELQFTDKRMRKLLEKLRSMYPDFPSECDHIKAELQ